MLECIATYIHDDYGSSYRYKAALTLLLSQDQTELLNKPLWMLMSS